jgi:murein peptide amidase A
LNFVELNPGKSVAGELIPAFKTDHTTGRHLYLMAGTHGDEVEGVYVTQMLFDWLREQDLPYPMVVIPILNIDGYRAGTRVNANGVDLNRNYPSKDWTPEAREPKYYPGTAPLSEPENKFLDDLFQKYPPAIILSFHSWKPFINYNGDCKDVAEHLASFNSYSICDDIEGHPTPGSLGEYGPQRYQSPVLTFECALLADVPSLDHIWRENEPGLKSLFKDSGIFERFLNA